MYTRIIIISTVLFSVGLSGCEKSSKEDKQQQLTFCNPLNLEYRFSRGEPSRRSAADPVIILFKDTYFLFSTGSNEYWHSSDLVHWELIPEEISELPNRVIAPSISIIDDAIYFTSSTRDSSIIYKSIDPMSGKWELYKKSMLSWDPALFQDEDGKVYNYFGCSTKDPIGGVELDKITLEPLGEIKGFIWGEKEAHGWEQQGDNNELLTEPWIEGAWMTKHEGTYYLQYSAPGTDVKTYADGVYTSKKPLGPFEYEPYSPFSHKPTGFIGSAGHGATFQDKSGNYWRVVTMVIAVYNKFERRIGIFPAGFDEDGVMYTNTLLGDYPKVMPRQKRDPFENNLSGWMLLSYGREASASSSLSGKKPGSAFDEDIKTWWSAETADMDEWLSVDLGNECTVNAVQVNFAEQNVKISGREKPVYHQYVLEYSIDGQSWKTMIDKSENKKDVPHDYIRLSRPVQARYIKLANIHTPGDGLFAVRDLRLFGRGSGEAPPGVDDFTVDRDPVDRRSAKMNWNQSSGASGYIIRYGITPDKLYNEYQVMGGTELEVNSLNRDVSYYFTVDAFNENGYTKGSQSIECK